MILHGGTLSPNLQARICMLSPTAFVGCCWLDKSIVEFHLFPKNKCRTLIYTYIYLHVCYTYVYQQKPIHVQPCMSGSFLLPQYILVNIRVNTNGFICIYIYTPIYIYIYICIYVHTHIHIFLHIIAKLRKIWWKIWKFWKRISMDQIQCGGEGKTLPHFMGYRGIQKSWILFFWVGFLCPHPLQHRQGGDRLRVWKFATWY